MNVAELRSHIERKFAEGKLERLPFPHMIIENFFPPEVYEKIIEYNLFKDNIGSEWISRNRSRTLKTSTPYDHRKQINFHRQEPYTATDEQRAFWDIISSAFLDGDWFVDLTCKKFPDYFSIRFGEAVERPEFWGKMRKELFLQRHDPNYSIGPHTDIPGRTFTCIFSFADRPGFEEFGTQLLRHHDPMVRCWGNDHYPFEGFDVVKTAPYAPNNFLLFFKTRQSFHAVKTITEDVPNQRYGMQFQLYEPGGGIFRDLSEPELMSPKHTNILGRLLRPFRRAG